MDSSSAYAWDWQQTWSNWTAASVPWFDSASTPTGGESASYTQNVFLEDVTTEGYGGGIEGFSREDLTRDDAGRVTQLSRRFHAASLWGTTAAYGVLSSYTYRPDGRIGRLVNPDGQHDFTYDPRGLMQTQTVQGEGTYSYGYDALGRNSALTYPDGHSRAQVFDDLGRLTSRCYDYGLGTVRCYTANYDAVGNPVRMTDPDGVDVLEYDGLDRLAKVTRYAVDGVTQLGVEEYAYNALGALKRNAGVALDDQRPRLDGQGLADAAVPATHGGQPVTLNAGGLVTSLLGASFGYSRRGYLQQALPPIPQQSESYAVDARQRRVVRQLGPTDSAPPPPSDVEFYVYEGLDRVATLDGSGAVKETYLFDGIDHPLRVTRGSAVAYYEVDLAGNVRGLRASGGADLGGYRYSAFGKTVEDTATSNFDQPLRWKGRWFSPVAGGIYDVRARQWSPELGTFLAVDEFSMHSPKTTLWGWPAQSPVRFGDPDGRGLNLYKKCIDGMNSPHAPAGFPESLILCLPWLWVPDPVPPPSEFPTCAAFVPGSPGRALCCETTCGYDPKQNKATRPRSNCVPDPYRGGDQDRLAEACYDRCIIEPQAFH